MTDESTFIATRHASGATIVETIKAVMVEYELSLREAKALVSAHPVWANVVSSTEPLIVELYTMRR